MGKGKHSWVKKLRGGGVRLDSWKHFYQIGMLNTETYRGGIFLSINPFDKHNHWNTNIKDKWQDTMVLWSNVSCILPGGWGFESRRSHHHGLSLSFFWYLWFIPIIHEEFDNLQEGGSSMKKKRVIYFVCTFFDDL